MGDAGDCGGGWSGRAEHVGLIRNTGFRSRAEPRCAGPRPSVARRIYGPCFPVREHSIKDNVSGFTRTNPKRLFPPRPQADDMGHDRRARDDHHQPHQMMHDDESQIRAGNDCQDRHLGLTARRE